MEDIEKTENERETQCISNEEVKTFDFELGEEIKIDLSEDTLEAKKAPTNKNNGILIEITFSILKRYFDFWIVNSKTIIYLQSLISTKNFFKLWKLDVDHNLFKIFVWDFFDVFVGAEHGLFLSRAWPSSCSSF